MDRVRITEPRPDINRLPLGVVEEFRDVEHVANDLGGMDEGQHGHVFEPAFHEPLLEQRFQVVRQREYAFTSRQRLLELGRVQHRFAVVPAVLRVERVMNEPCPWRRVRHDFRRLGDVQPP